jgi:hypothetical protein
MRDPQTPSLELAVWELLDGDPSMEVDEVAHRLGVGVVDVLDQVVEWQQSREEDGRGDGR